MKRIRTSRALRLPRFIYALIICALIVIALGATSGIAADDEAKVTLVSDHELPNVPGKSLRAVLVEYGPGAGSPSHRHPSSAFIYARVLEGAIRSKVNDAERIYQVGESWTEKPGDHHQVSQNASPTAPAKLLAVFVVETSDREIVIPDKQLIHR
jgi:quercetin dioxygenase-like cupin family protein